MNYLISKKCVYRYADYFITSIFVVACFTTLLSCSDTKLLQPLKADASILAFGDSLTYGTGTSRDKTYPVVLEQLTQLKVINAGVPSETSAKGLTRLPALLSKHNPDLIIICHGGNDILRKMDLRKTHKNIQDMITLAQANNTQVLLVAVPEFGLFLDPSPIYLQLAEANQVPVANNILSEILAKISLKSDRVHPNSKGYQLLAENLSLILQESGALP